MTKPQRARGPVAAVPVPASPPPIRLAHRPHPFKLERDVLELPPGLTIGEMVEIAQPSPVLRSLLQVRIAGHVIPSDRWSLVRPKPGVLLDMVAVPQGGSDTLRLVLTIAVIATAVAVTGGVAGLPLFAAGGALAGWGAVAGAVAGTAVSIGGTLAITALVPPAEAQFASGSASSATYSIEGGSNAAKPGAVIPYVIGFHRIKPDLVAPWVVELDGEDTYLCGLLSWGIGPAAVSELRIGESPIEQFSGVSLEHHAGDGLTSPIFTLYPGQVSTAEGSGLLKAGARVSRRTDTQTDYALVEFAFPAGAIRYSKKTGDQLGVDVQIGYRYRAVGSSTWSSETLTTLSAKQTSVARRSRRIDFPARGEYDIEVYRVTGDSDDDRTLDDLHWTALKSINTSAPLRNMQAVVLTAIRIKGSDQLSGVIDNLSGLVKSYGHAWDGSSWIYGPYNNPATMFLRVLQGRAIRQPVPSDRIDVNAVIDWQNWCAANQQECEFVADREMTVHEILTVICAAGRAIYTRIDGRYSVAIDRPKQPVQMFTARNMWGFQGQRTFSEEPHALRVPFLDRTSDYSQQQRIVYNDGYDESNASIFHDAEFPGITHPDRIWYFGRTQLAEARLRSERYTFETDFEHLVCTIGDLVLVQHPAPRWGLGSGRIRELILNPAGAIAAMRLEETLTIQPGADHVIRVRRSDAAVLSYDIHDPGGETSTLWLNPPIPPGSYIAPGDLVAVGLRSMEVVHLLIKKIEPGPRLSARLTCTRYAPGIFTAATQAIPAWNPQISPLPGAAVPIIRFVRSGEVAIRRNPDGSVSSRVIVTLYYQDGTRPARVTAVWCAWRRRGETDYRHVSGPSDAVEVTLGDIESDAELEVLAAYGYAGGKVGAWSSMVRHKVERPSLPPPAPVGLTWDGVVISWAYPNPDPDHKGFKVRWSLILAADWATAEGENDVLITAHTMPAAELPIGVKVVFVKAVTSSGVESTTAARLEVDIQELSQRVRWHEWDLRALGWPGAIFGGQLEGGAMDADVSDQWLPEPTALWCDPETERLDNFPNDWGAREWGRLVYIANRRTGPFLRSTDRMYLALRCFPPEAQVAYRWGISDVTLHPFDEPVPDDLLEGDIDLPLGSSGTGVNSVAWRVWRNGMPARPNEAFQLRITLPGSARGQPVLLDAVVTFDGEELEQVFPAVNIPAAAAAATLVLTKPFRRVDYVTGTIRAGSSATHIDVNSISTTAVVVSLKNAADQFVAGIADIRVGGT